MTVFGLTTEACQPSTNLYERQCINKRKESYFKTFCVLAFSHRWGPGWLAVDEHWKYRSHNSCLCPKRRFVRAADQPGGAAVLLYRKPSEPARESIALSDNAARLFDPKPGTVKPDPERHRFAGCADGFIAVARRRGRMRIDES